MKENFTIESCTCDKCESLIYKRQCVKDGDDEPKENKLSVKYIEISQQGVRRHFYFCMPCASKEFSAILNDESYYRNEMPAISIKPRMVNCYESEVLKK